jgi:hypothetical protein
MLGRAPLAAAFHPKVGLVDAFHIDPTQQLRELPSLVLALPQTADSSGQKQHCRQRSGAKTVRHLGEQW